MRVKLGTGGLGEPLHKEHLDPQILSPTCKTDYQPIPIPSRRREVCFHEQLSKCGVPKTFLGVYKVKAIFTIMPEYYLPFLLSFVKSTVFQRI